MTEKNTEYSVKKFTLPVALEDRLDKLANEHTGGNTSQFLRVAIEDHARTLDGQDEFEYKRLRQEVEELATLVTDLTETVEDKSQSKPLEPASDSSGSADSERDGNSDVAVQRQVHSCLLESNEEALNIRELTDRVDSDPLVVQSATESLLEKGYIEKGSEDSPARYRILPP